MGRQSKTKHWPFASPLFNVYSRVLLSAFIFLGTLLYKEEYKNKKRQRKRERYIEKALEAANIFLDGGGGGDGGREISQ